MKLALILPTYNSSNYLDRLFQAVHQQTRQPDEIIVVDSDSHDDTVSICERYGARVMRLDGRPFNHGGTRRLASRTTQAELVLMMTHDAVPASPEAFATLVDALLSVPDAGMAFGRQLAHPGAGPLARHHREFNYTAQSVIKRKADIPQMGIKTCWASDSFSLYRADALERVGGFPLDVVCCEDVFVAARMVLADYAVIYCGEAAVYHSHDYTLKQEFRRYFDNGLFYGREKWITETFGTATGEGLNFVLSELKFLIAGGHWMAIPRSMGLTVAKLLGYHLGQWSCV